jgi:hypothetical protein
LQKITGIYSVTVPGQQPVEAADASDFGQQSCLASSAQHGLVQPSSHAVFGQLSDSAQHGLLASAGHVFATDSHSVFPVHSPSTFAAKTACEAVQVVSFVA